MENLAWTSLTRQGNQRLPILISGLVFLLLLLPGARAFAQLQPSQEELREQFERRSYEPLAERIRKLAGEGWNVELQRKTELPGWKGRVNGYAFHFAHATKVVPQLGDVPAIFRITVTNYDIVIPKTSLIEQADEDTFFGYNRYYRWYYSPGTYALGYPAEWETLLAKIRETFGIPEAVDGVQCRLEIQKEIYLEGEPIPVWLQLHNLQPAVITIPDVRDHLQNYLEVTGGDGRHLPNNKTDTAAIPVKTRTLSNLGNGIGGETDIQQSYLLEPGEYTICCRYPTGIADHTAASQSLAIRVVPREWLVLRLSLQPPAMLQITAVRQHAGNENLSNLSFRYELQPQPPPDKRSIPHTPGEPMLDQEFYGVPIEAEQQRISAACADLTQRDIACSADLTQARWDNPNSSKGPHLLLNEIVLPGWTYHLTVFLHGQADGKSFQISSPALTFTAEKP